MQFMGHGLKLKESSSTNDPLMFLRARIMTQVEQVALDQKQNLARLSDDLKPFDSGLDPSSRVPGVSSNSVT